MRITQWGELGVHCTVAIAQHQRMDKAPVGAQEIANEFHIALDYTQQILQRLRKGGVIESVRGPQGGYRLAKPEAEISLADILTASEGEIFGLVCDHSQPLPERCHPELACGMRETWLALRNHITDFLAARSLSDLVTIQYQSDAPVQIKRRTADAPASEA
ncbi:MAG: Rrf2 family transcriptional regulator [Deltaproteobacteria bacterium]|nr:Rrf2 family transcriptional regulator [Deltaproteobacteria bacterium]